MSPANPAFETIRFPERGDRPSPQGQMRNASLAGSDRLLTPQQVADRLGVSERWVRDHATRRCPRIPAVKLGPLLRFRLSDIERFLGENSLSEASQNRRNVV